MLKNKPKGMRVPIEKPCRPSGSPTTKVTEVHDAVVRALDRHAAHADSVIAKLMKAGHQLKDIEIHTDATNLTRWKVLSGGKVVTVLELKLPGVVER